MTPDPILTSQISDWLNASPKQRSLEDGALLLLRLNANRIMYQQILKNRLAEKLEYELQKHLNIRLHGLTRAEVAKVEKQVMPRLKKELAHGEEYRGRRADHDSLPAKVKELYEKNGTRWRQMHRIFETLKTMRDAQPCDRHELVHQLVQLDDAYRADWEKYDHWTPEDEEPEAEPEPTEAGVREIIAARKAISYGRKKLASETDEAKRAALLIPVKNAVSVLRSANQTFREDTIAALKELGAW